MQEEGGYEPSVLIWMDGQQDDILWIYVPRSKDPRFVRWSGSSITIITASPRYRMQDGEAPWGSRMGGRGGWYPAGIFLRSKEPPGTDWLPRWSGVL